MSFKGNIRYMRDNMPTVAYIHSMTIPYGTILKVPYRKAMQQVEYRKFEVIGNYPEYVLCKRDTASGESYLSCFSKRDIYFGTLGSEEVEDESR